MTLILLALGVGFALSAAVGLLALIGASTSDDSGDVKFLGSVAVVLLGYAALTATAGIQAKRIEKEMKAAEVTQEDN